jgi:enoyl-CoA hydratase/carnithine racemase
MTATQERDRTLYLVLDRPGALNAVDEGVLDDLESACDQVVTRGDIRALVITGVGEVFSVGMDLACLERGFADHAFFRAFLERYQRLLLRLEHLPVPTVAAVNGLTRAGGFELLLACDLAVCADEARISDNHTQFGVIPGGGAMVRAPRRLGMQRAKEMIFTARWIDGRTAERIGLVLRSVPRADLAACVESLVAQISEKSRDCLAAAKAAMNAVSEQGIVAGTEIELREFFRYLDESPDSTEGFRAFREKRQPTWRS